MGSVAHFNLWISLLSKGNNNAILQRKMSGIFPYVLVYLLPFSLHEFKEILNLILNTTRLNDFVYKTCQDFSVKNIGWCALNYFDKVPSKKKHSSKKSMLRPIQTRTLEKIWLSMHISKDRDSTCRRKYGNSPTWTFQVLDSNLQLSSHKSNALTNVLPGLPPKATCKGLHSAECWKKNVWRCSLGISMLVLYGPKHWGRGSISIPWSPSAVIPLCKELSVRVTGGPMYVRTMRCTQVRSNVWDPIELIQIKTETCLNARNDTIIESKPTLKKLQ